MAKLRLVCYRCDAVMPADERKASKRARCPACDAPLRIPATKYFQMYDGKRVKCLREPEWRTPEGLPLVPPAEKPLVGQMRDESLDELVDVHAPRPSETAAAPPPAPGEEAKDESTFSFEATSTAPAPAVEGSYDPLGLDFFDDMEPPSEDMLELPD